MISRRKFIQNSAFTSVVSGAYFTGKVNAECSADIAAITGTNIESTVRTAVEAVGGIQSFVKKGDVVAVKPNLSFASPVKRAATTNPSVVLAVIKLCIEAGAKTGIR